SRSTTSFHDSARQPGMTLRVNPAMTLRASARPLIRHARACLARHGLSSVMPGLVPGIHVFLFAMKVDVDGRNKSGHDVACLCPASHPSCAGLAVRRTACFTQPYVAGIHAFTTS